MDTDCRNISSYSVDMKFNFYIRALFMNVLTEKSTLQEQLQSGLIVSCQPVDDGPMDSVSIIVAMAKAAQDGGCNGLRIQGAVNVAAVVAQVKVPVVGIIKRDLDDSPVRISPYIDDIDALAEAGARIIAFDGTDRRRPVPVEELIARIHAHGCLAMADVSNFAEGMQALQLGCEYIGTTLSGYTEAVVPKEPDFELVQQLSKAGCSVIAEGRFNSPKMAGQAIELGAMAVTVGSAITRIEHISGWFLDSIKSASLTAVGVK
ncbi:MAG: putative N-acetylmannosamine-6-phosphate epimerase [Reinekea sp.]